MASAYAKELLTAKPMTSDQAGEEKFSLVEEVGLEIYALSTNLLRTEEDNTWLFVRRHAKEVWDEVLKRNLKRSMVVGSPGIGKSFSTAYFLKRLLERNKLVVYELRSLRSVVIFVPPLMDEHNEEYVAYTTVHWNAWSPAGCPALQNPEAYYIIDPAKGSASEWIASVRARTVVPPSPDLDTLGDWRKVAERFFLDAWTQQELLAVRPYLKVNGRELRAEEVVKNHWQYGGIIRLVFASPDLQEAFAQLRGNALKDKKMVKAIYAQRSLGLGTKDSAKPPTTLFTLVPLKEIEEKPELRPFSTACIEVVSIQANVLLQKQYFKDLQAAVCEKNETRRVQMGWLFEDAVQIILARGGKFQRRYLSDRKRERDQLELSPRSTATGSWPMKEFLRKAVSEGEKYWVPSHRKTPLFDAAEGGTRELYQITLSMEHDVKPAPLKMAVEATGASETSKLILNWVVPKVLFECFEQRSIPSNLSGMVEQRVIHFEPCLLPNTYEEFIHTQ